MNSAPIGRDVLSGAALLVLSVVYFIAARELPAGQDEPGPALFPKLLAGALFVLALTIIARGWRQAFDDETPIPFAVLGLTALYAASFSFAGFFIGTLIYTFGVAWLLGRRGWRAGIVSVATTATIYLLLGFGLGVPLP